MNIEFAILILAGCVFIVGLGLGLLHVKLNRKLHTRLFNGEVAHVRKRFTPAGKR